MSLITYDQLKEAALRSQNYSADVASAAAESISELAGTALVSLEQTTESTEDGGKNIWTATFGDGTASELAVRNGTAGSAGASAYDAAVSGGYEGTEAEFASALAEIAALMNADEEEY